MPKGLNGEKRPADVIGNAVRMHNRRFTQRTNACSIELSRRGEHSIASRHESNQGVERPKGPVS
jgi:hypothetical protein